VAFAFLAVERVGDVAGAAARVAEDGPRTAHAASSDRARTKSRYGCDERLHHPQQIGANKPAAEERPIEAGKVVGVGDEGAGSPLDGRAADRDVLERSQEITVCMAPGDARPAWKARPVEAERLEHPVTELACKQVPGHGSQDQPEDVVVRVRVRPPRTRGEARLVAVAIATISRGVHTFKGCLKASATKLGSPP
jgi:hypothetical protein